MMYSKFAKYYDKLGWDVYAQAWYKKVLPLIEKSRQSFSVAKPDFKIIDLACGTGELCLHFRKDKYSTCGLDISKEMLTIAKRKNPTLKFYNKDIINFSLKQKFHIATCSYDSLNHIMTEKELIAVFKNINRCLKKEGVLLFDMNTIKGLSNWRSFNAISRSNHFILRSGGYDHAKHTAFITIEAFVKTKGKYYDRFIEVFYERGYPVSVIRELLKKAGFMKVIIKNFNADKPLKQANRIFVAAYK